MQVAWRRSAVSRPPTDDAGDPALIEQLREEIALHGPVTFSRFMEVALFDAARGYYATSTERPTREGDFLTAPEIHPIFGWVLARRVEALWRQLGEPGAFTLREYGAGTGTLAIALFEGLTRMGSRLTELLRYQPVDLPGQIARLEHRLAEAGLAERIEAAAQGRFVGCAIANEYVDALPVHRVVQEDGRLRELSVDWQDGRFVVAPTDLSDGRLAAWFADAGVELADGQVAEVNLAMLDWITRLGRELERGAALVLDYGFGADDLYGGSRPTGTVRAFRAQHVSSDALTAVGHQDITAHVDFDALERGGRAAGLTVVDRSRQAEFLLANGLDEAYADARTEADRDWQAALALRAAGGRLIDTSALGGYVVMTFGKGI